MASIIDYLPEKTKERIRREEQQFEKTFKLPTGTIEKVRRRRSGGGGTSSDTAARLAAEEAMKAERQRQEAQKEAEGKRQEEAIFKATLTRQQKAQKQSFIQKQAELIRQRATQDVRAIRKTQQDAQQRKADLNLELRNISDKTSPRARRVQLELAKLTALTEVGGAIIATQDIEKFIVREGGKAFSEIKKNPRNIIPIAQKIGSSIIPFAGQLAKGLLDEAEATARLVVTSPNEGIVKVGAIILFWKGTEQGLRITGKATKTGAKAITEVTKDIKPIIVKLAGKVDDIIRENGIILKVSKKAPKGKIGGGVNLQKIDVIIRPEKIDSFTKEMAKRIEIRSGQRFTTLQRDDLKKRIRLGIQKRIAAQQALRRVPPIARKVKKPTVIKRIRRVLKKTPVKKKRQVIVRLDQIEAQTTRLDLQRLGKKLLKEAEKNSGVKYTTPMNERVLKQIMDKLNTIRNARKKLRVPEIARKKTLGQQILRNIKDAKRKLDNIIMGRKPKIKKKVAYPVQELRQFKAARSSRNLEQLSKLIADKVEKKGIIRYNTKMRENLREKISMQLVKKFNKKAINKKEIINFLQSETPRQITKKISKQIVKPKPTPKVRPKRTIKTLKDFADKTEVTKGFQQVQKNGMVLLQKTKQVQKQAVKTKQVMKQKVKAKNVVQAQRQMTKLRSINSISKTKLVRLRNTIRTMSVGLVLLKSANASASAQKSAQKSLQAFRSDTAQISETITATDSAIRQAQTFIQKFKPVTRQVTKTKQVPEKVKKPVRVGLLFKKKKKKVAKAGKFIAYAVQFKEKGRTVTSRIPLRLTDAKDLLAYRVDRKLIRTGKIVPVGKVNKLGKIPKNINGAFERRKHKLRVFKLKKKKKVKYSTRRFIEKKKYVGDTKSEIRLLKKARKKKKR